MALERLKITKTWANKNAVDVADWDAIRNPVVDWSSRVLNYFKQIGLDLNGATYEFNPDGRATQTSSIVGRLDAIDNAQAIVGVKNIGLDLTNQDVVKIWGANGADLSATNIGYAVFNSTSNIGRVIVRNITANISLDLTGCHWGFDTTGDLTDEPLIIYLIDNGSAAVLGVGVARFGRRSVVLTADDETVNTSVNAIEKIYVSTALSASANCIPLGYVLADFDDTGAVGGENQWTIQNAAGDVNLGLNTPAIYF